MENPWELIPCPDFGNDFSLGGFGSIPSNVSQETQLENNSEVNPFQLGRKSTFGFDLNLNKSSDSEFNWTFPCWDPADILRKDTFKRIVNELNIYFTPVIIVIGTTGNLMAFLVFTVTHLRRQSSSVFLASLALADLGYLVALLFVWLSWIKIPIFHKNVWCQMVLYMEAVFTFLSVW